MPGTLVFLAWQRSGVYALASGPNSAGTRLKARLRLNPKERDGPGQQSADLDFEIMGPGDVKGLHSGAVGRRVPPPGDPAAETNLCVHAELSAADLPWRYTPKPASGSVLRPWLVLVTGTQEEIALLPDNQIRLAAAVTAAHPLNQSARWAHNQIELDRTLANPATVTAQTIADHGGPPVARLLSPRGLEPDRGYIAAIVPAFQPDGTDAWQPDQEVVLPVYHHWRFKTGSGGDFRTLAARLRPLPATGERGRAPLTYGRVDPPVTLELRGALRPVGGTDPPATVDAGDLTLPGSDDRGRPVVTAPVYGQAWRADPQAAPGWGRTVNRDPR